MTGMPALDEFDTSWPEGESTDVFENLSISEDELLAEFDVISPSQYVQWVQRSLNRLLNLRLSVNGIKNENYISGVVSFQMKKGLKADGVVGPSTQNALIKANEGVRSYMKWVHEALESAGIFTDPPRQSPVSGSYKSNGLRLGIREFQKRDGLTVDGFVGAKTDLALREIQKKPDQPKPHPPSWHEKIRQEQEKAKPLFRKRARDAISVLGRRSPTEPIKRTICILKKLLRASTDSRYVTNHLARAYADLAAHGAPTPWHRTENLLSQALDAARLTKSLDGFIDRMIDLDYEVLVGLREVHKQYQMTGSAPREATARRMRDWIAGQQRQQRSIYSCYT